MTKEEGTIHNLGVIFSCYIEELEAEICDEEGIDPDDCDLDELSDFSYILFDRMEDEFLDRIHEFDYSDNEISKMVSYYHIFIKFGYYDNCKHKEINYDIALKLSAVCISYLVPEAFKSDIENFWKTTEDSEWAEYIDFSNDEVALVLEYGKKYFLKQLDDMDDEDEEDDEDDEDDDDEESSSSYVVSYSLETKSKKNTITLEFVPEEAIEECSITLGMKNGADSFVDAIKKCETVDDLIGVVISETDFSDEFEESEIESIEKDIRGELENVNAIADIKSISVIEYFTGWGEFARDGVDDFIATSIKEKIDWDDEESVYEILADRFEESEIEQLIDQVQNDTICQFDASIITTIDLATGEVTKKYKFDGDN